MIEHTPEPWEVKEVMGEIFIAAKPYKGHPYFERTTTIEVMSDEDYPTKPGDAVRIAACINACAGISTEQLKKGALGWLSMVPTYAECYEQRNELLSACKELLDLVNLAPEDVPNHEYETIREAALEKASIAIKKAEEQS